MKTVLISGGTRGIGRALVERFLGDGWRTAFIYRSAHEEAKALEARGALSYCCDLANEAQVARLCARIPDDLPKIDAFISNAGIAHFGLFTDLSAEEWKTLRTVDLDAPVFLTRAVLPSMIRAHEGAVIYISSMWGQVGASCEAAYSAVKAGLIGLTKALAKEVGPSGIRVNCVCPGVIDTDMNARLDAQTLEELSQETPLGRIGTPGEVAALCAFLCSKEASFITGQTVGVNGGFVVT